MGDAFRESTYCASQEVFGRVTPDGGGSPPIPGNDGKKRGAGTLQNLEAQQRYFPYRAIPVAIISQNSFVLVFMGCRTIIARYVAKWGIAQVCLCDAKYQGGGIAPFWGAANIPQQVSRDMGYRSDSIAASGDMGPLSSKRLPMFNSIVPYNGVVMLHQLLLSV